MKLTGVIPDTNAERKIYEAALAKFGIKILEPIPEFSLSFSR
ncbi:hypothetical protein [Candidatus Coxiella mudrowiae]|nr:hypothetical protein [Candidatus Coxiella mudrowiae]